MSRPDQQASSDSAGIFVPGMRGKLSALLLASGLTVLAAAIIAPSLHAMKLQFADVPNVELYVQLILTTPALFIVIGSPIAGWLTDRVGRKPVLVAGLVFYAVAGSTGLYLNSIWSILAGRAALGLAVAGVMTAATTLLADYYEDEDRIKVLGIQAAFMGLGGVVFLLLGGVVAEIHWRLPFATYLLSLLILVPALRYITEPNKAVGDDEDGSIATSTPIPVGQQIQAAEGGARMPWEVILPVVLMVFLIEICFYLIPVQSPFRFAALGYPEPWRISVSVATLSGFFAVAAFQASRIRTVFGLPACFGIGFLLAGIGLAGIGAVEEFAWLFGPFAVMGAGFGLIMPNLSSWLAATAPQRVRGRAMGLYSAALFLGQFVTPFVAQPLAQQTSVAIVYYVAAATCILAAPIAAWIAPRNVAMIQETSNALTSIEQ